VKTAIVSYIEPEPGYAREFNRWYEDDHWPFAVLAGPGVIAGQRFVATRACKAGRPSGALFGNPARGSYLGVALVDDDRQAEWDAWVVEEMKKIAAENRLFPHREHIHTAVYRLVYGHAPNLGSYPGVVAVASTGALTIPGALHLRLDRTVVSSADPPAHDLALLFTEADPVATLARLNLPGTVGFASPFLATVPGTDTYVDDL
jgi:hypothetical protein